MLKSDDEKLLGSIASLYRAGLSFVLAIAGGATTIAKTLRANSSRHWVVYIAVSALMFSAIFELGAYETLINRAVKPDTFSRKSVERLNTLSAKSVVVPVACSGSLPAFAT